MEISPGFINKHHEGDGDHSVEILSCIHKDSLGEFYLKVRPYFLNYAGVLKRGQFKSLSEAQAAPEELVSEAFFRLLQNFDKINNTSEAVLSGWLKRTIFNILQECVRGDYSKFGRMSRVDLAEKEVEEVPHRNPVEDASDRLSGVEFENLLSKSEIRAKLSGVQLAVMIGLAVAVAPRPGKITRPYMDEAEALSLAQRYCDSNNITANLNPNNFRVAKYKAIQKIRAAIS